MTPCTVLTIGNFDGVHRGHRELIARARAIAGTGGRIVALTFDPHPMTILRPGAAPPMLTDFPRRAELLREAGADEVVRLAPTPDLLGRSPEDFVRDVVNAWKPDALVEGTDFHFGRARAGNVNTLRELGDALGFDVEVVEPQTVTLSDQSVVVASSSITRWLVSHGRVADVRRTLGRPYELAGTVVRGDRRGREIGFPTANLDTPCLLPRDGVYAAVAHLPDGRAMTAALHVGERATFNDTRRTVEAYILDWKGPLAEGGDEYGWELRYDVISWIRGQVGFETIDDLVRQIEDDVAETRRRVERGSPGAPDLTLGSAPARRKGASV